MLLKIRLIDDLSCTAYMYELESASVKRMSGHDSCFPALLWRSVAESQLFYENACVSIQWLLMKLTIFFRPANANSLDLPYWRKGLYLIVQTRESVLLPLVE
jgi:hypothetical protein